MNSKLSQTESKEPKLRIVLIGKTGAGKTSVKNTLLGRPGLMKRSASSQTTECTMKEGEFGGQKLAVIDTPGLMNTKITKKQVKEHIVKSITYAAPGPHVFLLVVKPPITKYDEAVGKVIRHIFGEGSKSYTLALLTHTKKGEFKYEDIQKAVSGFSVEHHCFDNTGKTNTNQVPELLEKINNIVKNNKEEHYTHEMFKAAQDKIQEIKESKPDGTPEDVLRDTVHAMLSGSAGEPLADLVFSGVEFVVEEVNKCLTQ